MSDVDFIVVDFDGGEMLLRCLRSLLQQSVRPSSVIVVDNGSDIPTAQRVSEIELPFIHVRLERNSGFTGGVNAGWTRTTAPFVALLNNDVELSPEWTEKLRDRLHHDATLGAAQSVILGTDALVDGAGIALQRSRYLQRGYGTDFLDRAEWPPVWGVSATATIYRREALQSVARGAAILDPRFFAYYEDVELSARLRLRGWNLEVVDEPLAVHRASATRARLGARAAYLQARNRHFVQRLHHPGGAVALLAEDLAELARDVRHRRIAAAFARLRGVAAGAVLPLRRG